MYLEKINEGNWMNLEEHTRHKLRDILSIKKTGETQVVKQGEKYNVIRDGVSEGDLSIITTKYLQEKLNYFETDNFAELWERAILLVENPEALLEKEPVKEEKEIIKPKTKTKK